MDPGFQPGERITAHMSDLTVDAVRVDDDERTWVLVAHFGSDGSVAGLALPVGTGIRFERVIPADGEPQPGELWADQVDNLYFAQLGPSGGPAWLVDVDAPSSGEPWEQVHRSADGPIYRVAQRPLIGGQS